MCMSYNPIHLFVEWRDGAVINFVCINLNCVYMAQLYQKSHVHLVFLCLNGAVAVN